MAAQYASHPRATVNRLRKRGAYDYDTIHKLIDAAAVVHVAFPPTPATDDSADPDPFPAILPMIGCTGDFATFGEDPESEWEAEGEPKDIYLHGYVSARLFRLSAGGELPVSIAATFVDGFKLALAPFHNSYNYRSAVVYGQASMVHDAAEKDYAMRRVTDSVVRGRWDHSRQPVTAVENKSTGLLRVRIVNASAKINVGMTSDDRADMKNDSLRAGVWTGVIPVYQTLGEPVPDKTNVAKSVPQYIKDAVKDANGEAQKYARHAVDAEPAHK